MKNKHIGSSLDDFLDKEGVREEFEAEAIDRVEKWKKRLIEEAPLRMEASAKAALEKPEVRKFMKEEHERMRKRSGK